MEPVACASGAMSGVGGVGGVDGAGRIGVAAGAGDASDAEDAVEIRRRRRGRRLRIGRRQIDAVELLHPVVHGAGVEWRRGADDQSVADGRPPGAGGGGGAPAAPRPQRLHAAEQRLSAVFQTLAGAHAAAPPEAAQDDGVIGALDVADAADAVGDVFDDVIHRAAAVA